ncbi:molybdopterin-dependent oxidoreductase [Natrialbaceae archaeon A-arb3/5]
MFPSLSRLSTTHAVWRVATAVIAAVAAICGSFAYAGLTPEFVADPAASFVVEYTPAIVVNAILDQFGAVAQPMSFLVALALVTLLLTAAVLIPLEIEVLADVQYLAVPLTAVVVWVVTAATTGAYTAAAAAALPAAAIVGIIEFAAARDPLSVRRDRTVDRSKRAALQAGFGTLSLAGISAVVGRHRTPDSSVPYLGGGTQPPVAEQRLLAQAERESFDLPAAPGLVSEIGEFYTVDINTIDPILERDDWELSITGQVDSELTIDYDELRERDAERFYSTLRCVGERLNEREMDNAVWTGVPMADLLDDVGPTDEAEYVVARAVDDYWNTITREELERSYLVYGMNGRILPREHGHPVRLIVPGNWGEVNVKWLTGIELVEENRDGYWEERDWDGTGQVETVAKFWSTERDEDNVVTVSGHAYAGLDGIDAVEVSTDGGDTWEEAELSAALDDEVRDVWRQWRYSFEPTEESHETVVRAIDGTGTVQTEAESDPKPSGATGWVSRPIDR